MPRIMGGVVQDGRLGEANQEDQREAKDERGPAGGKTPGGQGCGLRLGNSLVIHRDLLAPPAKVKLKTKDGRSPGSRVLAGGRLPGFPVALGRQLADYSCGGSRGVEAIPLPRSLSIPLRGTV